MNILTRILLITGVFIWVAVPRTNAQVTVSGALFDDNNGQTGGPNGTPFPESATLTLYAANGITVIATTTVNGSGEYQFLNVLPNNYVIGVSGIGNYQHVSSTDATPANGRTDVTVNNTPVTGVNFGLNLAPEAEPDFLSNGPLGSPVTTPNVASNDGDFNASPLSPDSITLLTPANATGITVDAQGDTTGFTVPGEGTWVLNPNGSVTFTALASLIGNPTPISYFLTDRAGLNSNTALISPTYYTVSISGTVYDDDDGQAGGVNGILFTDVPPRILQLQLYFGLTQVGITTTDVNGNYEFSNLHPGNYTVSTMPTFISNFEDVSSTDATTPANGQTDVTVANSIPVTGINFGLNRRAIGDHDALLNQVPGATVTIPDILSNDADSNDVPLSPDSITLVAPANATAIITDAQGDITGFTAPGEGTWTLNPDASVTFVPQSGFSGTTSLVNYIITDLAGLNSYLIFFYVSYYTPAAISGTVHNDNDAGTPGGTGIAGVTATLYAADGITVITTTTTAANGTYTLSNLAPGDYVIGITPPAGFFNVGSSANTTNGRINATVNEGTDVPGQNFGINQPPVIQTDNIPVQATPGQPMTIPNLLANDSDPNGGTLLPNNISLVASPGATGTITDAQGDTTGFTVPGEGAWSLNSSTGALTFTPQSGFTGLPASIGYSVRDAAGLRATATANFVLPVAWLSFEARLDGSDVQLLWSTAREVNTDRFEVEYATDGVRFQQLGKVKAAGNSATVSSYSLSHSRATGLGVPLLQYRIKQVDLDGQYTYSEVRSVGLKALANDMVTLYPNPVAGGGNLVVTAASINEIQVFNAAGRRLWNQQYKGESQATIPVRNWAAGTYLIKVNGTHTLRFIVQ